jgi:membrane fusion protein
LAAERSRLAGEIVVVCPPALGALMGVAVLLSIATAAFMFLGRYTDHATVTGMLVPERGVIEVRSTQLGRIAARAVEEGDRVVAGQRLFVLSAEHETSLGSTGAAVHETLQRQIRSFEAQTAQLHALERMERDTLDNARISLDSELAMLDAMIAAQYERNALADTSLHRYERMQVEGFVPEVRLEAERERSLDQHARLKTLERELAATRRHRTDVAGQLEALPLRYRNQRAELARAIASAQREVSEAETRRTLVITAPVTGTATAVLADIGRVVDASSVLVSLLPEGTGLRAHLYAPSRAIGFVEVGDRVSLRYRAYPYERFGHGSGHVESVSRTALAARELTGERLSGANLGSGPYYRVIVRPDEQTAPTVAALPLQAGMLLEAELNRETRKLYQWALDPYRRLLP